MTAAIQCTFADVTEHDMDLLFLEEFVCSDEFLKLFTQQIGVTNARVLSVHSSLTDVVLGESDITVVLESDGKRIALLIENKIDAIAMPEYASHMRVMSLDSSSSCIGQRFKVTFQVSL